MGCMGRRESVAGTSILDCLELVVIAGHRTMPPSVLFQQNGNTISCKSSQNQTQKDDVDDAAIEDKGVATI